MHEFVFPQSEKDRIIELRGRLYAFERLQPAATALLVVDMQNAFVEKDVGHAWVPEAKSIVPNINAIAGALRGAGGLVVWIKNTFTEESAKSWSHFHDELWNPERKAKRIASMSEGTLGHELCAGLEPRPEDPIVLKTRYSAFIQGASNLESILHERGIGTVLVTGTVTNVCCESTARDAMMLNFRTIMVSDANAATSDESHSASLASFWSTFGDVRSSAEVIDLVNAGRAGARNAAE